MKRISMYALLFLIMLGFSGCGYLMNFREKIRLVCSEPIDNPRQKFFPAS